MVGILREFADAWEGIIQDPFMLGMIQGHLLTFKQNPPPVKSTHRCVVKVLKTQESMMASEVRPMLPKGTIEVVPGKKGLFTYPFLIPKKNKESHFIMNLGPLNQSITCKSFKMTTLKQIRDTICPVQDHAL